MNGVLVIDKPSGPTSHDVVVLIRRATGTSRIGHTGTLDPMASGVLPLVIGRAARLAQFLANSDKDYEALIKLGVDTDTYDITGQSIRADPEAVGRLTRPRIDDVLQRFRGSFLQEPPVFSAKRVNGIRAHRLARRGRPVQLAASMVDISRLELMSFEEDRLSLRLTCSPGFYVRTLAHDIGAQLGTGGCLQALRRLRSGEFGLDRAVSLEAVVRDPGVARDRLIPMSSLLRNLPGVTLTPDGARRAACGSLIGQGHLEAPPASGGGRVRLLDPQGELVAIAEPSGQPGVLHPAVVVV